MNWRRVERYSSKGNVYYTWKRENGYYREPTAVEKANAVYNNFDCLDAAMGFDNLWRMQGDDAVIGFYGDLQKKANSLTADEFGYGLGPAL